MLTKWLRKKFRQFYKEMQNEPDDSMYIKASLNNGRGGVVSVAQTKSSHYSIDAAGTNFTIFKADGGFTIQHYEINNDYNKSVDNRPLLTIVPNGEELGKAIEHILTYRSLSK